MVDQLNPTPDSSFQPDSPENPDVNAPATPDSSATPTSWESPPPATAPPEATAQPTPPVSSTTPPKKSPLLKIVFLLLTVVLIVAIAAGVYKVTKNKTDKDSAALKSQITALQSNSHELPAGAVKVSDCIPNMGSHYLPTDADPEYGPFVLVTKAGKVIGLEYMASQSMYSAIPNTDPPVQLITKNSPLYGWKYDHIEFSHLPKGHEGFMVDHIDVHLFTVPPADVKQACI